MGNLALLFLILLVVGLCAVVLSLHDAFRSAAETERQIREMEAAEAESRRTLGGTA